MKQLLNFYCKTGDITYASCSPLLHVFPRNPGAQVQVNSSPHAMQVPPFSQGLGMHTCSPAI